MPCALSAPLALLLQPLVSQFMMVYISSCTSTLYYSLCQIASLKFIGLDFIAGKTIDRKSISYSLDGSSSSKIFRAFNALGAIAFSFGDAMLPEIQVMHTDISFQILV